MTAACLALRARIVFPISSPPVDGGIITIQDNKIAAVGENTSSAPPRDLGDVALLPGLINAHTHLEFSELPNPLGEPSMSVPDWIDTVVMRRREDADRDGTALSTPRRTQAIRCGIAQSLQGGATTIGDIATWDVTQEVLPADPPRCFAFRELIGLTREKIEKQLDSARAFLASVAPSSTRLIRGLSPHAPYTAAPDLVNQVTQLSKEQKLNVAMHLAESPEELQLLSTCDGPFRDLLQRFEVWDPAAFPGGVRPLSYLRMLSQAHRSLVIHGNYLDPQDWSFLANHRDSMSVVYCPRTHEYFRHAPYPLSRMMSAGVRVVLGTDGRASNPDLNLLSELQFTAARHADLAPRDLLSMATLSAAESLGCANLVGSLECGKQADLAIVKLGDVSRRDPHTALFDAGSQVCGVWTDGVERASLSSQDHQQNWWLEERP